MMSAGWYMWLHGCCPRILRSPSTGVLLAFDWVFGLNSGQPEVVINRQLRLAIQTGKDPGFTRREADKR